MMSLLATTIDVAWFGLQLVLGAGIAPQAHLSRAVAFNATEDLRNALGWCF